ncbi:MAG: hypothetical protein KKH93_05005 [Candidatus Omnitrophica bacterium]|nr:hypothetical protein [Candidatus Omnitrophota bacterium]MBU2043761.1 hypothetical protein [Candidatus Omnitrophota bacterium]MBU2251705.1 hypothetical protein [Candidatus Omnitrophota bacterium]MBU2265583.1 hypothetical protein [Candidatus Omnitrophota bacterium]MBU2473143.1 hypothetical protein [Candidatus Omnitrophota bacterium]
MGRPKKELKRIHRKKAKKAKKKVQAYSKKEITFEKLSKRSKHFLEKKRKQERKTS